VTTQQMGRGKAPARRSPSSTRASLARPTGAEYGHRHRRSQMRPGGEGPVVPHRRLLRIEALSVITDNWFLERFNCRRRAWDGDGGSGLAHPMMYPLMNKRAPANRQSPSFMLPGQLHVGLAWDPGCWCR